MPTTTASIKSAKAQIQATSQQTRFDPSTSSTPIPTSSSSLFTPSYAPPREIDIHDLNLTISNKQLLSEAHLKLLPGVKYLLHGQNGTGKSTILRAIKERIIPGLQSNVLISLLQQREEGEIAEAGSGANEKEEKRKEELTALELVVQSDEIRMDALRKRKLLQTALEDTNDPQAPSKILRQLKHERQLEQLELARKEAELRSRARGAKARRILNSVEDEVEESLARLNVDKDEDVVAEIDEAVQLLAHIESELEAMSADTAPTRAETLLLGLGFTDTSVHSPLSTLSGGWKMRAHLAAALFVQSHILLLDEPTSFLDFSSLLWLEDYLSTNFENNRGVGTILVLVSHDRQFADNITDETILLRDSKLDYFQGNLSSYSLEHKKQQKRMTKMKEALNKQKDHINKTISNNLKMAKKSGDDKRLKQIASRSKKLEERMGMQVNSKGGRFKLSRDLGGFHATRRPDIVIPKDDAAVKLKIPLVPEQLRFPGPLLGCENLAFSYYTNVSRKIVDTTPIFQDVNLSFRLGEKIGFVGLNGAGKSTLISCLVGSSSTSAFISSEKNVQDLGKLSGTITRHPGASIGYYSQEAVNHLPSDITALEYLSLVSEQATRSALASLGLSGRSVSDVKIGDLSGGQRVRVALTRILFPDAPHVLVIDEVTTHLDADTVQVLAEQLRKYRGTLILVSHDRWFLNAVLAEKEHYHNEDEEEEDLSSSDESDIVDGFTMQKEGTVFWVDRGKVKRLTGGVDEFEMKIRKRAAARARKEGTTST